MTLTVGTTDCQRFCRWLLLSTLKRFGGSAARAWLDRLPPGPGLNLRIHAATASAAKHQYHRPWPVFRLFSMRMIQPLIFAMSRSRSIGFVR